MKALHICNCYMRSKVHYELYSHLDKYDIDQIIYVPESEIYAPDKNSIDSKKVKIICSKIEKPYHRYLYPLKIRTIAHDLEKKINLGEVSIVHATTFFSDGAVALRIKKKYGIPFVVAVRGTDVNAFARYRVFWPKYKEIVKEAERIFFVTPNIKNKFVECGASKGLEDLINKKSIVIPNGINDFWVEHKRLEITKEGNEILYIGRFMHNKNVKMLIDAIEDLKSRIPDIRLNLIGGGGELNDYIIDLCNEKPDYLQYHGRITDKERLLEIVRKCNIFAMISLSETFGLVYVEALSQGLPILYTKNQGVDGVFQDNIGEKVDPRNFEDVKRALIKLLENRDSYRALVESELDQFDWNYISAKYLDLYRSIVNS